MGTMNETREPEGARKKKMPLRRQLGLRIIQARKRRGWHQEELASRVGATRAMLGRWERGLNAPSLEGLAKLSEVLEVTLEELVLGHTPPAPVLSPEQRNGLAMSINHLIETARPLLQPAEARKRKP
jgi:transcriptional regulator with XRE-family HTH domain